MLGHIIQYPGCILDEVNPTIALLKDRVDLRKISLSQIKSDLVTEFLIVPGGSCDKALVHKELHKLIQGINKKKSLLAGICNGALVLASAGVLKNRRCTHTAIPKYAPASKYKELLKIADQLFIDSLYTDEDVVVSDNVITAKPWASIKFADAILKQLHMKSKLNP